MKSGGPVTSHHRRPWLHDLCLEPCIFDKWVRKVLWHPVNETGGTEFQQKRSLGRCGIYHVGGTIVISGPKWWQELGVYVTS